MQDNNNASVELDITITLDEALNMIFQRDRELLFANARIKQLKNTIVGLEAEINSLKK